MLTILDKYIMKRLLDYFLLGVVLFTLVLFFSDALLDFMKTLQHHGIPGDIVMTLVGLQIPRIVAIVIPMSAMLAALMVYNNLNSQFELVAMRMSGISLYRLSRPAIFLGIMASVITFALHDYIVPLCNKYTRGLETFAIHQQNLPAMQDNFIYKQFDENQQLKRLLYVSHFKKRRLGYTTVIDLTHPDTLQVTQARAGTWGKTAITLDNAAVYTVSSTQKLSNTTSAGHLELQHFFKPTAKVSEYRPKELSFFALRAWVDEQARKGDKFPPDVYVDLWEKITVPLSALPLVLIAVPLAISAPRKFTNIGAILSIVLLFLYYLIRHISVQLGDHSVFVPIVAASLPLFIISITAFFLFYRKNMVL
jgi:lipopolysaccharide export system permease protein